MTNDFEYLIYPEHSDKEKIAFGVRSVALNANVCVRTSNLDPKSILSLLTKMQFDLEVAANKNKLISGDPKDHLCSVISGQNYCQICGEFYK